MRDVQGEHMCFMSARNANALRTCARAHRQKPRARAHTPSPAEDQSAERSCRRSIQAAERLRVDASPSLKQPMTRGVAGRRQLSSQSAVRMLFQRRGCGSSLWHGCTVTGGALSSLLIAFGTTFCVCGSDFCGPRSEGIV